MKHIVFTIIVVIALSITVGYFLARPLWTPVYQEVQGKRSVSDVINIYGADAEARLRPYFVKAGVSYPPSKITLLAIKNERRLELWANDNNKPTLIRDYQIKAASGVLGPKLVEGDRQVPEGIYQLEYLNPNSAYHLSFKLNYPNAFDQKYALIEGRNEPGTNIFIHGKSVSIGCLAMGDQAIEELFVLVAKAGRSNVTVAIVPTDPRLSKIKNGTNKKWVDDLYQELSIFFDQYRLEI